MTLDLTSLGNAVQRLREGLTRYEQDPADEQIREGQIQRFEYTYELAHKMLGRYLKESAAASADEIDRMAFADLIRTGSARGLLSGDWPGWRRFREMRARTNPYLRCQSGRAGRFRGSGVSAGSRASLRRVAAAARMIGAPAVDLPAHHRHIVVDILNAHLPHGSTAWVFGSRVTGRARRYSDLDLAIDAARPLTLDEIAVLGEAFSDSD